MHMPDSLKIFFISFLLFFETGSGYVAQAGLKHINPLPQPLRAGMTGMHHQSYAPVHLQSIFCCYNNFWGPV